MELDILKIFISLIGGLFAGLVFFAGLWLTLKLSASNPYSWLILIGSYILRFLFLIIALFAIAEYSGIAGLLAATPGFIGSKLILISFVKSKSEGISKNKLLWKFHRIK